VARHLRQDTLEQRQSGRCYAFARFGGLSSRLTYTKIWL